jgi:Voltage gated chloride channel
MAGAAPAVNPPYPDAQRRPFAAMFRHVSAVSTTPSSPASCSAPSSSRDSRPSRWSATSIGRPCPPAESWRSHRASADRGTRTFAANCEFLDRTPRRFFCRPVWHWSRSRGGSLPDSAVCRTGYVQACAALHGACPPPLFCAPLRFAATALSLVGGLPGGVFSPSLLVGAGLVADIAWFFPKGAVKSGFLLDMVSQFTGVVHAPIAAFVIIQEMTVNHGALVPATGISTATW